MTRTRVAQVVSLTCAHHIPCVISMRSCCVFDSCSTSPLSSSCCPSSLLSSCFSSWTSTPSSTMWWANSLCTSAKWGPWHPCRVRPSHRLWAQRLPHLGGYWTVHPGILRRERVPEWPRVRWRHHRHLRSLHHCSPRSEKMMRAADELITLMTKVGRPVSRRLSVMERGDPLWYILTHRSQTSEKFRNTAQKMSKSGFFWNDKESRFSLTVKQRFENTNCRQIMTEKVFKVEWNDRVAKRRNLSCSSRRRTTSTRSTTSSWTIIGTKLGSSWNSWEKPQWDGRIEAISRLNIRHNCEEKIGRRSRYYPWTHKQDSGITEWN